MSPATIHLTPSQWQHAVENTQKRVDAKTLECTALRQMIIAAPGLDCFRAGDPEDQALALAAANNYFEAKLAQAEIDLEELELRLAQLKAAGNSIVVPR